MNRWLRGLGEIDRRWLYLTLAVTLSAALLARPLFPDEPSGLTLPVFERIESLPPGSPVLVSLDYSPGSAPEIEPMALALTRHLLWRGARPVYVSLFIEGDDMFQRLRKGLLETEFAQLSEGRDWVHLGFKSGGQVMINSLVQDLSAMYASDVRGTPTDSLVALAGVRKLEDFPLIISLSSGTPGLLEWIIYGGDPTGTPVAGGCTSIGMPEFLVYFPAQLKGLLGGLKGASEYEAALAAAYPEQAFPRRAGRAMGPQTVAHVVILIFLVLGNAAYLRRPRQGNDREAGP
jgi:hypothetical protein